GGISFSQAGDHAQRLRWHGRGHRTWRERLDPAADGGSPRRRYGGTLGGPVLHHADGRGGPCDAGAPSHSLGPYSRKIVCMKIAWFTPLNRRSAIGQYSACILNELGRTEQVVVHVSDTDQRDACWPVNAELAF